MYSGEAASAWLMQNVARSEAWIQHPIRFAGCFNLHSTWGFNDSDKAILK
jgi:hypothetical protein